VRQPLSAVRRALLQDRRHLLWIGAWCLGALFLFAAVAALGYVVVHEVPERLSDTNGLTPAEAAAERGRLRAASLAFLAGVVTATGAIFTGLTFWLSRRGQATDRFTKAVEQLGHATVDVRLGGIHALGRLARDSRTYHGPVVEVLSAYVREHAHGAPAEDDAEVGAAPDVKAAMVIVALRRPTRDDRSSELDFAGAKLGEINLEGARLRQARFTHAHLRGARLGRADLRDTNLIDADLRDADFAGADLRGAMLDKARLDGATLADAVGLTTASLAGAVYDPLTTTFPPGFDQAAQGARPAGQ
jgi:hypothetical protein